MVEHKEKLVERSTSPAVDILEFAHARKLERIHSLVNPHCNRKVWEIYDSLIKLAQAKADKDVDGRPKVFSKTARRQKS